MEPVTILTPPPITQPGASPVPIHLATTAPLVEVFSAIQGEGLNVGTRQIFIRFGGCDLRCHYCDSAHTWHPSATCRVEQTPGQRDFTEFRNPVTCDQLLAWVQQLNIPRLHDSISLTGGEPLLQVDFLADLLPQVRQQTGLPIYLETAGHLPQALTKVLPHLDLVGMDIKLPSVSGETHWDAHQQFLWQCQRAGVEAFCKLIISEQTDPVELARAAEMVAAIDTQTVFFLQPVTPLSPVSHLLPPSPEQVLGWQALAKQWLPAVRVVPQTHKMLQQL